MEADRDRLTSIPVDGLAIEGILEAPSDATGVVVFAHRSGSSRKSPRNNFVAEVLGERGLGTLLFELLTEEDDRVRENRFEVPLLTDRLVAATAWLREQDAGEGLDVGYFGSSTAAAAALGAAARPAVDVQAIVSRGGRVDLAADGYADVRAPTLLIVGGNDTEVLERNRTASEQLAGETPLHVVESAGHLFEGEEELEAVADAAADWFEQHLQ
jgi:dienelactone hydrolase